MTKAEAKKYLSLYRTEMARAERLKGDMALYTCCGGSLQKEIDSAVGTAERIERLINAQPDLRRREILARKYIYGETLEEIALHLNYSVRHVQRLLDTAVASLPLSD